MTKAERRAAMPESAALIDEMREIFGTPVYGRFEESGLVVEWGKRTVEGTAVEASEVVK